MAKSQNLHRKARQLRTTRNRRGSTRFVCIHGHFYQPPRENPWLETVEVQDSAAPYHDWNDRITAECYAPNGASRITNKRGRDHPHHQQLRADELQLRPHAAQLAGGQRAPHLPHDPRRRQASAAALRRPRLRHRAGLQPHHHAAGQPARRAHADPLGHRRLRASLRPQARRHVARRDRRQPQRARPDGAGGHQVHHPRARTSAPASGRYRRATSDAARIRLDSTRPTPPSIPPIPTSCRSTKAAASPSSSTTAPTPAPSPSRACSTAAKTSASAWSTSFAPPSPPTPKRPALPRRHRRRKLRPSPQARRDGALLRHALDRGRASRPSSPTTASSSTTSRPQWEAEVVENTSWSCAHGVERWRSDCGCNGGKPGWNQEWRAPLREALDYLRDAVAPLAEELAAASAQRSLGRPRRLHPRHPRPLPRLHGQLLRRPRQPVSSRPPNASPRSSCWSSQRHTQLMYTSCGWFFDEISGIETVQIIAYAGRVLQLAAKLFGEPGVALEAEFLDILAKAKSNIPEIGNGAEVYRRYVTGMRIGLEAGRRALRHQLHLPRLSRRRRALLLRRPPRQPRDLQLRPRPRRPRPRPRPLPHHRGDARRSASPSSTSATRTSPPPSSPTLPTSPTELAAFTTFSAEIGNAMRRANLPEVIRLIDHFFGDTAYSLTSLFADEQHRILNTILNRTLSEMEDSLRKIYEDHASLLHFLTESGIAAPPALALAASFAINASLRRAIEADPFDPDRDRTPARPRRGRPDRPRHAPARLHRRPAHEARHGPASKPKPPAIPPPSARSTTPSPSPTPCASCPSTSTSGRRRTSGTTCSAAATRTTGPPNGKKASKNSAKP